MIQKTLPVLWLCGFLCALFFFNAHELESFGLSADFLFVWSVVSLSLKKEWHVPQSKILMLMGAFWLLAFTSLVFSNILNSSIMAFVYFSAMPIGFFTFVLTARKEDYYLLTKAGGVLFGLMGLWALVQYFFLGDIYGARAHHPLKNPNSLAALFNFGLFAAVGWMLVAKEKLHSNLALLLAIVVLGGIVATVSRGAILAMLPMMGMMLFFLRGQAKQHWKCLSILLISGVIFVVLASTFNVEKYEIASRIISTANLSDERGFSQRTMLWSATIEMIKAHGLFGTGIGTYFQYFNEFRLPEDKWGTYYAHSDPLQFWVELGVLGPVLFYGFCIAVLLRTIQAVKKTDDVIVKSKILVPFFAMGAIALHAHITFNFYNLSILYMSGFMLAVWFMTTQEVLQTSVKIFSFPSAYTTLSRGVAISLPFLIVGFFFFATITSEHLTQKAKEYLMAGDLEKFASTVISAQRVGFGQNYRADLLAVNMPLTLLANPKGLDNVQRKEIFDQGLFYLRRAHAVNPRSASALYYLGLIQEDVPKDFVPNDLKEPIEYYREALRLDPLHFSARMAIARDLPKKEAAAFLEKGAHYRYTNPQALDMYMTLLSLFAQTGQAKKMKETSEKIRSFQTRIEHDKKRAERLLF